MPQHRDLGVVLDVAHELARAARDDEVDVGVELEEVGDLVARGDELHERAGQAAGVQRVGDDGVQGPVGVRGLLAALEQQAVAAADGQRRDLGQRVRAGLEDDHQHAQRRRDLLQRQALRHLHSREHAAHRVRGGGQRPNPLGQLRDLPFLELQALQGRGRNVHALRGLQILGVLGQETRLVRLQGRRDGRQRASPRLRAQRLALPASRPRLARHAVRHGCLLSLCV
mmetsp:Transcript_13638/g.35193  ORF Transcript_13638/g.35193 Transcript_13638/m.35193 type:complete len:227 (-) Transcript_13638:113-793(-)